MKTASRQKSHFLRIVASAVAVGMLLSLLSQMPDASVDAYSYTPPADIPSLYDAYPLENLPDKETPFMGHLTHELVKRGVKDATTEAIDADLGSAVTSEGAPVLRSGEFGLERPSLVWTTEEWVEFRIQVPEEGFYNLEATYHLYEQKVLRSATRSVMVDGSTPFTEAVGIPFDRFFEDAEEPRTNGMGDEVRPRQVEVEGWYTTRLSDATGFYADALRFHLEAGEHTIRLLFVEGAMALSSFRIVAPLQTVPYEEYAKLQKERHGSNAAREIPAIEIQAESSVASKSDGTLSRVYDGNPATTPNRIGNRLLNAMGGNPWRYGGQTITWTLHVAESGYYRISLRFLNNANNGISAYRTLRIDGEVPFSELKAYAFPYNMKWQGETLGKSESEPYIFYLGAGDHTLSMTVTLGPLTELLQTSYYDMLSLATIYRSITKITGSDPDLNFEYFLQDKVPGLIPALKDFRGRMDLKTLYLMRMGPQQPSLVNNLRYIVEQFDLLVRKPNDISRRLSVITDAQSTMGDLFVGLQQNPLTIDYYVLSGEDVPVRIRKAGFLESAVASFLGFLVSFGKDYRAVSGTVELPDDAPTLEVWASQGREWAELIKELSDESFSSRFGVKVKVGIMPSAALGVGSVNVLMLSIASGTSPDIALGIERNTPVEIAIRGGLYDLSRFEDYSRISSRFVRNTEIPFRYRSGVYAVPETMDIRGFFYRTDIFEELGLAPPETWDELYEKILPVLYQNNMQCYIPQDFSTFLFQLGGRFYTEDGLRCALDSKEAFTAFEEYCGLFNNYGSPITANFYMRMRTGEMPCGIGSISEYRQLLVAAPEINGKWRMTMIPGHERNGVNDRSIAGITSTADAILADTDMPDTAWAFLDWWTSADTQIRFGSLIEAQLGPSARWNPSNTEAWKAMPWDRNDLEVMESSWAWVQERPVVLGGYITDRSITNAWNRVVVSEQRSWNWGVQTTEKMMPRESLEQAIQEIQRELEAKQEEYGIR